MTPDEISKFIPDEAVEAAGLEIFAHPEWSKTIWEANRLARAAIAAGLGKWPVQFSDVDAKGRDVLMLVFPLTQKDATDEW